jgi:tRNA(fMet)-specific endonuclease VapC
MTSYLLDTNICIYIMKSRPENLSHILKKIKSEDIGISSITLSELEYGVYKSTQQEKNAINLLKFSVQFQTFQFDDKAARFYGKIRADLEKVGKIIGNMDMLIGAHALALQTTLVTNNEREFKRIKDLKLINWLKP